MVPGDTNVKQDIFLYDIATKLTSRISLAPGLTQANGNSYHPAISADGRYIGYFSYATNLVPGDTNAECDLFVFDRETGTTTRIDVTNAGRQTSGVGATTVTLSADGRLITYYSDNSQLVPGDTNQVSDVFLYDQSTRTTTRISFGPGGVQANSQSLASRISGDGSLVTYFSNATNLVPGDVNDTYDTFVYDTRSRTTSLVSRAVDDTQGNDETASPSITPDGKFIAVTTDATNFAPDDTNGVTDIYLFQN